LVSSERRSNNNKNLTTDLTDLTGSINEKKEEEEEGKKKRRKMMVFAVLCCVVSVCKKKGCLLGFPSSFRGGCSSNSYLYQVVGVDCIIYYYNEIKNYI